MGLFRIHSVTILSLGFALMACGEKRSADGKLTTSAVLPGSQALGVWNLSSVRCGDDESVVPLLTDAALSSRQATSLVNVAAGESGYKVWEYMGCRLTTPMNFTRISDTEFVETDGDTSCEALAGGSCDGIPSCGIPGGTQSSFTYQVTDNSMLLTMPSEIAASLCGDPNATLSFSYVR